MREILDEMIHVFTEMNEILEEMIRVLMEMNDNFIPFSKYSYQ